MASTDTPERREDRKIEALTQIASALQAINNNLNAIRVAQQQIAQRR